MFKPLMCFTLLTSVVLTDGVAATVTDDLLIENVSIVSARGPAPVRTRAGRWVLIQDGRIAAIASRPIKVASGTARLDGRGKFLTPGLMDSHVHLTIPAGLPFGAKSPAMDRLVAEYHRQQPRSYLYFGVTQVLDPANLAAGMAVYAAQPMKPDTFRCGAAPVLNGYPRLGNDGHAHELMPDFIIEPANTEPLPAGVVAAEHTPEAVVARIAASDAPCIKVFIENGFGNASNLPVLQPSTLARVRKAAHAAGLAVVAHANALDMQTIAVAADVDVIAHGIWNWGALNHQPGVPEEIAKLMRVVHAKGIGYQPTLRVMGGMRDLFLPGTLEDPTLRKVVPASLLAFFRSEDGQFFKAELRADFDGESDADINVVQQRIYEQGARVAKYLADLGHPLLLGSDTPSAPVYANQPGYNSFQELRSLAEAGVSLEAVLRAGTINNARQFGLERDYGSVEKGKIANLLLLAANPLESVDAWSRIDTVVLHGRPLARATLAADAIPSISAEN